MRIALTLIILISVAQAQSVLTPSGYKNISLLNVGDVVIGRDGEHNVINGIREFKREQFDPTDSVNFMFGDGAEFKWFRINGAYDLFCTQNIYVASGDYKVCHVNELKAGWKIYKDDGSLLTINTISEVLGNNSWYKFDISGDHSYISDGLLLHNAARYWVGGGSAGNWNSTVNTNWGSSSGTQDNASVPGVTDDVTFDGAGVAGNTNSTVSASINILSLTFTAGYTKTLTINSGTTLTVAGNFTDNTAHTWTIGGSTSTLTISAASTITSNGKTYPGAVFFTNANTKTLSGDWTISGLLTIATTNTTINWTTNEVLHCAGGITCNLAMAVGTAKISIEGGTWTGTTTVNTGLANNVDINGNVTFATNVGWFCSGKTLKYVSGTVTTTGSTFYCWYANQPVTVTLDVNGINFNNFVFSSSSGSSLTATISLTSNLTVNGIFYIYTGSALGLGGVSCPVTFSGTGVWTFAKFYLYTVGNVAQRAITLVNNQTYTITSELKAMGGGLGAFMQPVIKFTSDHATNKANLTLSAGATCSISADFTRIDASGGRTINTWNGTVTSCTNVNTYTDLKTTSQSFVQ